MGIAVPACMFPLKCLLKISGERQVEFVSLAAVADVDALLIMNFPLPCLPVKIFLRSLFQCSELLRQARMWKLPSNPPQDRARVILDDVADQNSEGRQRAGQRGHN